MTTLPRPTDVNYDEARVGPYQLPDPLLCFDGSVVSSPSAWFERRRPELVRAFATQVYGQAPGRCAVSVVGRRAHEGALAGLATCHQLEVQLLGPRDTSLRFWLALWLPSATAEPAPAFLGLNFFGNHSLHADPALELARGWLPNRETYGIGAHVATEASRGCQSQCWPVQEIIARGYAVASVYAGDFDPDFDDGFQNGVHGLFAAPGCQPAAYEWGSISAWAWGLSHALDVLALEPGIDAQRVAAIGHSRLGKAALWAAALDERFAMAISNSSGRGGAALSRRRFGELTRDLNRRFPHWFCANFRAYDDREQALPVDQHELLSLLAPRPVYVASAEADSWADPKGEFLACQHAAPVFQLLRGEAFEDVAWPPPLGESLGSAIGYHLRPGGHDLTLFDWRHYLAFADRHFAAR